MHAFVVLGCVVWDVKLNSTSFSGRHHQSNDDCLECKREN